MSESATVKVGNTTVVMPVPLRQRLDAWITNPTQEECKSMEIDYPVDTSKLWAVACKNCAFAGNGLHEHNIGICKKIGNPCAMKCPFCKGDHWVSDCPQKGQGRYGKY